MTELSRREFLAAAAGGLSLAAGGGLLAACGSGSSQPVATTAPKPHRGGTLKAGLSGGTSSDTLNALAPLNQADDARVVNLYESLLYIDPHGKVTPLLAEAVTSNSTGTVWTIHLQKGVTFHNGKDFTAADVIYTFQQIANPKTLADSAPWYTPVDIKSLRALDKYTVEVPCNTPFAYFPQVLAAPAYGNIIPEGYDVKNPVGTGPFKLKSFQPGVQSIFVRNEDYWQSGLPYVDELEIIDFPDEQSQVNALLSGEVHVVDNLSAVSAGSVKNGGKNILISLSSGENPFVMNTSLPPFTDVRVRQAMRLLVDRPQMLDVVFEGHGILGNDIFGYVAPEYDHAIPQRVQDIQQAKFLLKAAGQENLSIQMTTSPFAQGLVSMATVFAQQAKQAGVTVNLQQVTPSVWFGPNFLRWRFTQDFWYYYFYLPAVAFRTLHGAVFNETHFNDSRYNALFARAAATVDTQKRYELEHEMMMIDYDSGGYIIPFFVPVIDGFTKEVQGLVPSVTGLSLNSFNFKELWFS